MELLRGNILSETSNYFRSQGHSYFPKPGVEGTDVFFGLLGCFREGSMGHRSRSPWEGTHPGEPGYHIEAPNSPKLRTFQWEILPHRSTSLGSPPEGSGVTAGITQMDSHSFFPRRDPSCTAVLLRSQSMVSTAYHSPPFPIFITVLDNESAGILSSR